LLVLSLRLLASRLWLGPTGSRSGPRGLRDWPLLGLLLVQLGPVGLEVRLLRW
jgi:hypothetical protein